MDFCHFLLLIAFLFGLALVGSVVAGAKGERNMKDVFKEEINRRERQN